MNCLGPWEKFLHDRSLPPVVQIALAHFQFEAIHPFLDGNGRVGRLLITLFPMGRDALPSPLQYPGAFFEATRSEYYDRLSGAQERGDREAWLLYFLEGVARQSEDALQRAERINSLLSEWREKAAGPALQVPARLVDLLVENPFWSVRRVAERFGVAFITAQRAVERLQALSILKQVGEARRDRVYCATDLPAVLEAPSRPSSRRAR